ncbi:MAG: hypothetical protein QGD92_09610 [Gammaproteobacteria bacterium]|nr:hypothetical protein [Gammaproteobacteria bacterium]
MSNNRMRITLLTALLLLGCTGSVLGDITVFGNLGIQDDNEGTWSDQPVSGSIDLFYADRFGDKFSGLFELVFEDTKGRRTRHFERFSVKVKFSDALEASIGRFHIPVGYWNRAMHHGRLLHDTAERPFFIAFEETPYLDVVIPVHMPGIMINGRLETSKATFKYFALFGSSQAIKTKHGLDPMAPHRPALEPPNKLDTDHLAISLRAVYQPRKSSWSIGVSALTQSPTDASGRSKGGLFTKDQEILDQDIVVLDYQWQGTTVEVISSAYFIRNKLKVLSGNDYSATAYYLQAVYKSSSRWRWIYRHEALRSETGDEYFRILGANDQSHNIFTARFDLNDSQALKFEIDFLDSKATGIADRTIYRMQWSFMIR